MIERRVRATCASCEISIGRVALDGAGVTLFDLAFTKGRDDARHRFRAVVTRVRLAPRWSALLTGRIVFDDLEVDGAQVTLIDHAEGRPQPSDVDRSAGDGPAVERVHLKNGMFIYVRDRRGTHAVVAFRRLRGEVLDLTTPTPHAKLTGQLGFSGEMRIEVKTLAGAPGPDADVEIWFNDLNLADLSAFFEPNAGVELGGALHFAHATSRLRGTRVATRARAVFDDFELAVKPDADRGGWTAFFTNLGIAIGIKQSNSDLGEAAQTRALTLYRRPNESLVGFLLRGIKDAVFSVAKKPAARALTE